MKKYFSLFLIFVSIVLLGASCKKVSTPELLTNWPEFCKEKDLAKGFPTEYIYPDSLSMQSIEIGFGGESGGEEFMNDGFTATFCVKGSQEEVKAWYNNKFTEEGFASMEEDGELMFYKSDGQANVQAYPVPDGEGFTFYSVSIMLNN